jgi:outer membrane protein TolC
MRPSSLSVVVVHLVLAPLIAHAELTLGSAVDAALSRSPGRGALRAQAREAEAAGRETFGMRLPRLSARSGYTRGDDPVYVFGSLLRQQSFSQEHFDVGRMNEPALHTNFNNALELGVPLFSAWELQSRQQLSALAVEDAALRLDLDAQRTRFQVADAYLRALQGEALVAALDRRVADAAADIESARKLQEKGLVLGSDYEAARAIQAGLRMRRVQAGRALEAARGTLAILLGVAPEAVQVSGRLNEEPFGGEGSVAEFTRSAETRPELREAGLQEKAAAVNRRQADASVLPRLSAFGMIEANSRDLDRNPLYRMFGVRAEWPFGDFSYLPRRERARQQEEAARGQRSRMQEAVGVEVTQAYQRFKGAQESVPLAAEAVERAEESLKRFWPLYREGRQSILEVLRAEAGLADAQAGYWGTLYEVHQGYAGLLLAAGVLDAAGIAVLDRNLREVQP